MEKIGTNDGDKENIAPYTIDGDAIPVITSVRN